MKLTMGAVLLSATTAVHADTAVFGIQGVTDPNVPAGYVANEIFWDGGGTVDWSCAALRIDLAAGSFYQNPYGGNTPVPSQYIDLYPSLEFDTAVGIIGDNTSFIVGAAGELGAPDFSMDGPQISVTWGNTSHENTGFTRIGTLTLSNDATGTGALLFSPWHWVFFSITNGQIPDVITAIQVDPTTPPAYVAPDPFPQLPGPPPAELPGIKVDTVSSSDVPDGYVANELLWYGAGHEDWKSTAMRVDLTSGDVYQHPLGFDTAPNPLLIDSDPGLAFDTYLGIVGDRGGGIAGGASSAGKLDAGSFSLDGPMVSASWANIDPTNTGTERIGMLTFSEDANGVIAFYIPDSGAKWSTTIVNGVIQAPGAPGASAPAPPSPEPATFALIALATPALLRRR